MSARKKWRLKRLPLFTYESAPSMKKAYERVGHYREMYAEGMSRIHEVVVEVDGGNGWQRYEVITFPERAS